MKNIFKNIKNYFKDNKTKSITILLILILTIVSSITLIAYSFYQNKSRKLIISGIASLDPADVSIKVYRENKNENGVGINTYSLSYYVPSSASYNYVSSKTVCGTGITITKYENQKFYVDATKKGKCKVYFDAIDGYIDDYEVNLFVQNEVGNTNDNNYNKMGQLPLYETGYYYTINTSKTSCTNGATVSIEGRNIVVLAIKKSVCNVYADKNSDSVGPTVSNLSVDGKAVTFTASDNIGLAMYGLSSSNTIAPDDWYYFSGTSQSTTFEYATEGTYYLWVKDTAGNNAISEAITITLDAAAPAVGNIDAYTKNAVIALSDDNNLAGYAVTKTSTTPTSWTAVSGKNASVTYPTTANGTYYVHVKDAAGKTSSKSFNMGCAASISKDFAYNGSVSNYTTMCRGKHTLTVWGAQGGNTGGKGGYSTGVVNLNENMNLYIYVGGQGSKGSTGGFNGGGTTGSGGGSGGGASDIRIGTDSLSARVIVAGGGGGSGYVYTSSTASSYPSGCKLTSSYYLTNASTTAGSSSFPSTTGGTETGHSGNGYARIVYNP